MKIESVDFFYLSMPLVQDIGDGSQDALLVRIRAGPHTGWGECDAAPLACIAAWNGPMSHSACKPVSASVLGQPLDSVEDIRRLNARVRENSFDLLQADHTLSGVDIALWDLLGKQRAEPVFRLLGYKRACPKTPYASQLFGQDPQTTFRQAQKVRQDGYRAAKFGWGPYGRGSVEQDAEQVQAAREGLGPEGILLVDAGTVWQDHVALATQRLPSLQASAVLWLEEPFVSEALQSYADLARQCAPLKLAAGEGCHHFQAARNLIDFAAVGYIQIDAGRIGGITTAKQVADYAAAKGVRFVNHTFTNHLALSASLQPYAGLADHELCEYPVAPSPLATELTAGKLGPDRDGRIQLPANPGLGIEPDLRSIRKYLLDVEIRVAGKTLYQTPALD